MLDFSTTYYQELSSHIFLGTLLNPTLLGLGLTYSITLIGSFEYCVRKNTDVENIVSAVLL